jgi:hypothetical protein
VQRSVGLFDVRIGCGDVVIDLQVVDAAEIGSSMCPMSLCISGYAGLQAVATRAWENLLVI